MINSESGSQVRLAQVADVRIAPATSIIQRQGSSRRIDVSAKVDERALGDVADDVARNVKQIAFPFEHRAEVLGEYKEQRAALRSIYSYMAAAAVLMFLLTQAVLRSWTLSALSLLGVPVAALGGLAAAAIARRSLLARFSAGSGSGARTDGAAGYRSGRPFPASAIERG